MKGKKKIKPFRIFHWDTFDNTTILVDEAMTLRSALMKVEKKYKDRISISGADRVDIVNREGAVVRAYSVC